MNLGWENLIPLKTLVNLNQSLGQLKLKVWLKIFYINLEDLLKKITIEDRVYRLRCVEAWSMVIPWQGFPLSN